MRERRWWVLATQFGQTSGLVLLAFVTLVLCVLAVRHTSDLTVKTHDTSGSAVTTSSPSADSSQPSGKASPGRTPPPPKVGDEVIADFTSGDALPPGSRIYDNQAASDGMSLDSGALVSAVPTGADAVSSLETKLKAPVRKLTAQVRFPAQGSGSVVLVAWQSSLVDARRAGDPVPASGLRLVVTPRSWQLTTYQTKARVLGSGTYSPSAGSVTFALYRQDGRAWVVDPAGKTTSVQDADIQKLAGPWACWQLQETKPGDQPAQIEAISAG